MSVVADTVVVEGKADTSSSTRTAAAAELMEHASVDVVATAVETAPLYYQLLSSTVETPTYSPGKIISTNKIHNIKTNISHSP